MDEIKHETELNAASEAEAEAAASEAEAAAEEASETAAPEETPAAEETPVVVADGLEPQAEELVRQAQSVEEAHEGLPTSPESPYHPRPVDGLGA